MTTLDHSSVSALVDDIRHHFWQGSLFRFEADGGGGSTLWSFLSVAIKGADQLWFRVDYRIGGVQVEHTLLRDGWLLFVGSSLRCGYVVSASPPPLLGSSSSSGSDDSQRLNDNLRGVFA